METHYITLTIHDYATRYGLSETDVHEFVDLGLLGTSGSADTIQAEPDHLARLARLHHELGISKEAIDIVLAMRQRLLEMHEALTRQTARTAQLERYLRGSGPVLDSDS
jgi:chaperone modulatory protein CbpM